MRLSRQTIRVLVFLAAGLGGPAFAAAPVGIDDGRPATDPAAMTAPIHELDREMVVRGWVLCVTQAFAEQLARAREAGREEAEAAYAALTASRSCGQFEELHVILRSRLYSSPGDSGHEARVFAAEVMLADSWASGFVVYGGLPAERR